MNRISLALAFCAMLTLPAFASAHGDCGCHSHPVSTGCGCDAPCGNDCGCNTQCDPCATSCCDPCDRCDRPRKRLRLVRVSKDVCRRQRVCTTNCCGCPTSKTVRVRKCVTRLRLKRVEVAPRSRCKTGCNDPCQNQCDPCGVAVDYGCGCN